MGFAAVYVSSCDNGSDIRVIEFDEDLDLDHYLNPIVLIICYFVVAITSRVLLGPQVTVMKFASKVYLMLNKFSLNQSANIQLVPILK